MLYPKTMPFHGQVFACFLLLSLLYPAIPVLAQPGAKSGEGAPPFVWIEAEQTAEKNVPGNVAGWGRKEFLTNDSWFAVSIPVEKVDAELPAEGALLKYSLTVPQAGKYEVWNRIGYEFVRSPFEWRIDNGTWKPVSPQDLTTDLMAIDTWVEVAWLKMGDADLAAGSHTLEIRLPKTKDDKGKTARVLYASDALCLTAGKFYPNGKYKPNETGRDAKDESAAKNTFTLPEYGKDGKRVTIPLAGDWEVCRNDEQTPPFNIAQPMQDFPEKPVWKAIPVPSDKNVSRPDLVFAHRLWYRTRVNVPLSHEGRSFFLTFPRNNLNTTVYVNGTYCGFEKNPNVRFEMDITKGIKPGQMNEIWVGIRDAWYGYSTNPNDPMKLRSKFNIPLSFVGNGFQDLAYPLWHAWESGIVQTPTLTSAGAVYAADVFVKPSVANKRLGAEITVQNNTDKPFTGTVTVEAVDAKDRSSGKRWQSVPVQMGPKEKRTVAFSGEWADAKLWWPQPDPQLYSLNVGVAANDDRVDTSETRFGFREWGAKGKDFILNGMVWHGWADLCAGDTPQDFLAQYRKSNQRFFRLAGYAQGGPTWRGLTPSDALRFADENGMVVRRSGDLDGEAIGYMAIENDPDLKKLYGTEIKQQLMENWRDQMVAQVKAERNHPSIHVWSIENEWLYINCINLYGGLMDKFETEVKKVMDAVAEVDPTRLSMVDGGGAGKDQLFPIHGDHYVFGDMTKYPELAYQANPTGGGRGRWVWDEKRPRYLGEDFYANGINPADFAVFGGEETFLGKAATRRAAGTIQNMLTQGYRWAEYGAWHFWLGSESATDQYLSFAPLAVFCRQWDTTFMPGQKVTRTLGIFNDTFDVNEPITLKWTLVADGKTVATETSTHTIAPGTSKKLTVTLPMPKIRGQRAEGKWFLTLAVNGQERFRDVKPITVLNPQFKVSGSGIRTFLTGDPSGSSDRLPTEDEIRRGARTGTAVDRRGGVGVGLSANIGKRKPEFAGLFVYDPAGTTAAFLKEKGIGFTPLNSLGALPQNARVLILGKDALTEAESTSSRLAAWVSEGRRLIVLEQKHPLKYQAFPAEMLPDANSGRTAFIEDASHPVFVGLTNSDFFTWAGGEVVYRDAYQTPTRGAKSLLHCDNRLARTAIAEIPVGEGLILVNQTRTGETLTANPVAQQLLANMVSYAADYKREFRPVASAGLTDPQLVKTLDAIGVSYSKASNPLQAIAKPGTIAIIEATPQNLQTLAANRAQVDKFTKGGGWLVLLGLTPDGLESYNKIVGFDHMIRPFRRERVSFPAQRHPLSAGLSQGDIVLSSGQRINSYTNDVYVAEDAFGYVVDYDEVAPFAKLPEPSFWGNEDAANDHNPYNIVNGFNSTDGWQLIFSMWAGEGGKPYVPMSFPKPQEFAEIEWTGNAFYYPTRQIELSLTNNGGKSVAFPTVPNNEPQTFTLPEGMVGDNLVVAIRDWVPAKEPSIVGIDNIRIKAKRSEQFYKTVKPLLNIGAMMVYERDKGGILLSNVRFLETEAVPENKAKKQKILATLLRNLKAKFGSETTVIAGAPLQYTPVDISKQANQYRDDKGWFGDKNFTFKDLPTGRQTFAGVPFDIYNFATSPVPNAVMLGGSGVPNNLPEAVRGIPVGQKADALFFLQTARLDNRRNRKEVEEGKQFEMARYVVTYEDGKKEIIPLYAETDIDDYRQKDPAALPGAQIAWKRLYQGTEFSAVAYLKQWNNPRPDVAIRSIDLEYGKDRRGVPVLLAVTAAKSR
ncbi:MAG: hypothetical protein OHK0029_22100 [Armatimonadaceae bacterium]